MGLKEKQRTESSLLGLSTASYLVDKMSIKCPVLFVLSGLSNSQKGGEKEEFSL
jgi:hypothetical protein